jgi:LmbE family N-acetylglucosaminyl deacetylase
MGRRLAVVALALGIGLAGGVGSRLVRAGYLETPCDPFPPTPALAPGAPSLADATPPAPVEPPRVVTLSLPARPRVLVFAPHPDDETVAVGALIARLTHRHVPVRVAFVTNGDGYASAVEAGFDTPRPTDADFLALGELRQGEARRAARHLGLGRRDLTFLGFPDGGLAELWLAHWSEPYTSPFTKEDRPPYPDALNPDADYDGRDLTSVIARVLRDFRPTVVVMPHPYDRHADHQHTGYFVTEAVAGLQAKGYLPVDLTVLTYLVHYPSWPATRPPLFDRFLPIGGLTDTVWRETDVTPAELAAKRAALGEYRSQLEVMNGFLRRFLCRNELYGSVDRQLLARIASIH